MDKVRRKETMEEGESKLRRPLIRMKPLQLPLLPLSVESGNSTSFMFSIDKREFQSEIFLHFAIADREWAHYRAN